jgi:hypothetical protein
MADIPLQTKIALLELRLATLEAMHKKTADMAPATDEKMSQLMTMRSEFEAIKTWGIRLAATTIVGVALNYFEQISRILKALAK